MFRKWCKIDNVIFILNQRNSDFGVRKRESSLTDEIRNRKSICNSWGPLFRYFRWVKLNNTSSKTGNHGNTTKRFTWILRDKCGQRSAIWITNCSKWGEQEKNNLFGGVPGWYEITLYRPYNNYKIISQYFLWGRKVL